MLHVTNTGKKPNPKKISAIIHFPIPKTTKKINEFLGLCEFYRKFLPNFANVVRPAGPFFRKDNADLTSMMILYSHSTG